MGLAVAYVVLVAAGVIPNDFEIAARAEFHPVVIIATVVEVEGTEQVEVFVVFVKLLKALLIAETV